MDRRSWLWRRKSSEKSLGETESTGSVSSHSDDQVYPIHRSQSPDITSKAASADEALQSDSVKTLTEKLSAALQDIRTKEELVKQHAKVAEEAISGWENAEKEVLTLRQHLEASVKKNSSLEDRVSHLDAALKECVRQLRQANKEQQQKIHEAISKKESEWESTKVDLDCQLSEVRVQLESAKPTASVDSDLHTKLDEMEKKNAALKSELLARAEEVEMRILERDLSTQAAEAASKQHLETRKKVVKLEAECRRLRTIAGKVLPSCDVKSAIVSTNIELSPDSQSDTYDKQLAIDFDSKMVSGSDVKENVTSDSDSLASSLTTCYAPLSILKAIGSSDIVPLTDINLLDDFLEMERLAALPDTSRSFNLERIFVSDQASGPRKNLNPGLEAMKQKIAALEQKLDQSEAEKADLVKALIECQDQLQTSQCQLEEAAMKLVEFEMQLTVANKSRKNSEKEAKAIYSEKEMTVSQLRAAEGEIRALISKVGSLQKEAEKECALSAENAEKCQKLEEELQMLKLWLNDAEANVLELQTQIVHLTELHKNAENEVKAVNARRELAESQLKDSEAENKELISKISSIAYEVEKERAFSAGYDTKCQRLEDELGTSQSYLKEVENKLNDMKNQFTLANEIKEASKKEAEDAIALSKTLQCQLGTSQSRIEEIEAKLAELDYQLTLANDLKEASKKEAEDAIALSTTLQSQLRNAEAETKILTSKIHALEEIIEKERASSTEYITKCRKLEEKLSTLKQELEYQQYSEQNHVACTDGDLKIRQEKELADAANKLAECQKTIASLGEHLNSLVTLDELLDDFDEPANFQGLQYLENDREPWKLNSSYFQQHSLNL